MKTIPLKRNIDKKYLLHTGNLLNEDIRYFEDKLVKALGIPKGVLKQSKLMSTSGASYLQWCIKDLKRLQLLREAHELLYQRKQRGY